MLMHVWVFSMFARLTGESEALRGAGLCPAMNARPVQSVSLPPAHSTIGWSDMWQEVGQNLSCVDVTQVSFH